jgi:bis(5'-nucleosidyl)-tetraphosphatase
MKFSAGIILVDRQLYNEPSILCLRAYSNWDFPKGEIEEGEKHFAAALRELKEETGYSMKDISFSKLGISIPWLTCTYGAGKSKKTAYYNIAERVNYEKAPTLPVNPELGKPEHDEWQWVKISELSSILPDRLQSICKVLENLFIKSTD